MYVTPGNDASQWTRDLWLKGVLLIVAYLFSFSFLDDFVHVFTFLGFCSQPTVDQPTGKQSIMDNGEVSLAVAVGFSDR